MTLSVPGLGDEALANAVFERVKVDLMKLDEEQLLQVNLDIPAAVSTVFGVLPELRGLREEIAKELPSFNLEQFDKLEDYALALSYAQAKFLAATQPPDDLAEVAEKSTRMRERLLAEAKALALHGIVSDAQLAQLKGANGYKNVATDLMVLTNIMQANWAQIEGKTLSTKDVLDEASRCATRLLRIVGLREQGPAQVAEATDLRMRAFTLLLQTYDDARRAVAYLRPRDGEADSITPALHPGRPRRRPEDPPKPPEPVVGPPSPVPNPITPAAASAPAPAAALAAAGAPAATAQTASKGPFM